MSLRRNPDAGILLFATLRVIVAEAALTAIFATGIWISLMVLERAQRDLDRAQRVKPAPAAIDCQILARQGPPDNRHVRVTGCRMAKRFSFRWLGHDEDDDYHIAYLPVFPQTTVKDDAGQTVSLIAVLHGVPNPAEVRRLQSRNEVVGLIWDDAHDWSDTSIPPENQAELLARYPQLDIAGCRLIVALQAPPTTSDARSALWTGRAILILCGLLLAWMLRYYVNLFRRRCGLGAWLLWEHWRRWSWLLFAVGLAWHIGFSMLAGIGAMMFVRMARAPQQISCAQLGRHGTGGNAYVGVTDFRPDSAALTGRYAFPDERAWSRVFVPLVPAQPGPAPPRGGLRVIASFSNILDDEALRLLLSNPVLYGYAHRPTCLPGPCADEEQVIAELLPGVDSRSVWIVTCHENVLNPKIRPVYSHALCLGIIGFAAVTFAWMAVNPIRRWIMQRHSRAIVSGSLGLILLTSGMSIFIEDPTGSAAWNTFAPGLATQFASMGSVLLFVMGHGLMRLLRDEVQPSAPAQRADPLA